VWKLALRGVTDEREARIGVGGDHDLAVRADHDVRGVLVRV
jgi:hypothetical protein